MALATATQVEATADALTQCADEAHERVMKAIERKEVTQAQAQSLFQEESALRQRANALYIEAAKCVVEDLELSQKALLQTIGEAKRRLKTIQKITAFLDLLADLVGLATAVTAAKPGPILAAFKEVRSDLDALQGG